MSKKPIQRLQMLRKRTLEEQQAILVNLSEGCPIKPWPFGMPSSASPHVVLLGVSPGSRPRPEDRHFKTDRQVANQTPTFGIPNVGFSYEDPGKYWKKASDLCRFMVRRDEPSLSDDDALALGSHLNLGTGQHGRAGRQAIEEDILNWVSSLLNSKFQARLLVCFGLNTILKNRHYCELWNREGGLPVDWRSPSAVQKFGRYWFRFWKTRRADGESMGVLMWPNHPSRHPFSGGAESDQWVAAKFEADKFLSENGF